MKEQENDAIIDINEKKKKGKSSLFAIVFLTWFIGSIVAMVHFSKINPHYSIMIFGQYFLVFSLIPLTKSEGKDKLVGIPFLLVGAGCVIIPYLMMNPELLNVTIIWDSVLPLLAILGFVIGGVVTIILPVQHHKETKLKCTEVVLATVVEHKTEKRIRRSADRIQIIYCPVYSFYYNGKEYKVSNEIYSEIVVKPIGTTAELKINPNNPEEFWDGNKFYLLGVAMGIIFLLLSVPILIYILNTFQFIA